MTILTMEQGSMDWYAARLGIPTASQFHRIITPGGKPAKAETTRTYMLKLISERLLGDSTDDELKAYWAERGKLMQNDAARQFTEVYGRDLRPVGLVTNDELKIACSPDALAMAGREGVEIKSPAPWTLLGYHLDGLGNDYKPQVQGQILAGNFDCVHFYAYHPRMPAFYRCTLPDPEYLELLKTALALFNEWLDADTAAARKLGVFQRSELIQPMARQFPAEEPDAVNVLEAG
jgi:hypothetical protein